MARKLRCLADFRESESSTWITADDVADDFRDRVPEAAVRAAAGVNTGSRAVFDEIELELAREGVEKKARYLRQLWETSDAWPPEHRFPADVAPFGAHSELRAQGFRNRRVILRDLIRKHGGRVSQRDVVRWRQSQVPAKPAPPWLDESRRLLDLYITRRIGDRRRRTVAEARGQLIDLLREAANALEAIE